MRTGTREGCDHKVVSFACTTGEDNFVSAAIVRNSEQSTDIIARIFKGNFGPLPNPVQAARIAEHFESPKHQLFTLSIGGIRSVSIAID
jgi:hypothetical protein